MEIKDQKDFDITNTIDAEALAKRWGVTKKTIDNRRLKGESLIIGRLQARFTMTLMML